MKKWILPFVVVLLCANIGIQLWSLSNHKKVAYVRSHDLIYNYEGMKDAQHRFNKQKELWQANLDTLQLTFQLSLNQYQQDISKLTIEERKQREQLLSVQQNNIKSYQDQITEKSETQEAEFLDGVLGQVNAFVQQYAENKGYDIVFGTTLSGSVLYGKETLDITESIKEALNQYYHHAQ